MGFALGLGCRNQGDELKRREWVVAKREMREKRRREEWSDRRGLLSVPNEGDVGGIVIRNETATENYDEMLRICWSKQECWSCLGTKSENGKGIECSWCPSSQTCIPNPHHPSLFAPFINPDICPLWYERYELRTSSLGCHVSTITLMAVTIAVLASMLVLGMVVGLAICVKRWNRERKGWWKVWRWRVELRDVDGRGRGRERMNGGGEEDERRALLGGED